MSCAVGDVLAGPSLAAGSQMRLRFESQLLKRWQWIGRGVSAAWVILSLVLVNIPLNTPTQTVAAVQPDASVIVSANMGEKEIGRQPSVHAWSNKAVKPPRRAHKFIVWPEGSLLWDPQVEDRLDLTGLAQETDAHLAVGYVVDYG